MAKAVAHSAPKDAPETVGPIDTDTLSPQALEVDGDTLSEQALVVDNDTLSEQATGGTPKPEHGEGGEGEQ